MSAIDTHVHLDQIEFDADREAVISRSVEAGVEAMICVGVSAASSQAAVRLAESHAAVYAAVGIQPNYCADARPDDWARVVALAQHPRVVAIGETGLDRHWDFTPLEVQQDYFDRHLQLAADRGLPVIVHCRECEAEAAGMLRGAAAGQSLRGVLHAFGGTRPMATTGLELGLSISFAGSVTYRNRKFLPLHEVAKIVPDDRLLVETDSPYLVPHPLRGRQARNEPALLVHTVRWLAELRGATPDRLSTLTAANARRLFGLP